MSDELTPPARNGGPTKFTPAVFHVELPDGISVTTDHHFPAIVTGCLGTLVPGDIPEVNIMYPFFQGQGPQIFKG